MLTDNFYKNVLNVIAEDAALLRDAHAHSVVHTEFNPRQQGIAASAYFFSSYLNAIKTVCETNETSTSFIPTSFLPEKNPSINAILNPGGVGLENIANQEDGE